MRVKALFFIFPLIFFGSCATIFGGRYNSIIIGELADPKAQILLDGKPIGKGPGKYRLKKGVIQMGSELSIIEDKIVILKKTIDMNTNPAYLLGDFLLLGLGLLVDVPNGNIYRPIPRKFMIKNGHK